MATDYLKDSILSVSDVYDVLGEVFALTIFMHLAQTVNYLRNRFLCNGTSVWNSSPGALKVLSGQHVLRGITNCMF